MQPLLNLIRLRQARDVLENPVIQDEHNRTPHDRGPTRVLITCK